jgi:hypothetical protein
MQEVWGPVGNIIYRAIQTDPTKVPVGKAGACRQRQAYRCAEAVQQGRPSPTERKLHRSVPARHAWRQVVDPADKSIHYYPCGELEIRRLFGRPIQNSRVVGYEVWSRPQCVRNFLSVRYRQVLGRALSTRRERSEKTNYS